MHRFDPATAHTHFTLGLTDYARFALFPSLFRKIRQDAPHVSINLRNVSVNDALRRLNEREIEFAIVSQNVSHADFSADKLFCEDYAVLGDPAFVPLEAGEVMPLDLYLTKSHALCSFAGDRRGWVDDILEERGLSRNVQFVFQAFSSMIANLRGTNLLAVVPRRLVPFARQTFGLSHWELSFPSIQHEFHLVMRRQRKLPPARVWFKRAILSIATGIPAA
jgi:LysR family transcriptional activator of mexEF-oprN operon